MCLSNVYDREVADNRLLFRNIADVRFEDGKILMTDIMGIRRELSGVVKKIDLMDNYIIVESADN